MFDILFGWPKASKCKKLIKRARCRLKLLKNKRQAIVRHSREDVAELIKSGHQETAFNRVEQLIRDESLVATYELLDNFCEFLLTQLSYIRRHRDCPNDINEAASSLIFASARCGDIPELCAIRKLFGKRYGQKFAATAVELLHGNLVNIQLRESLSEKSVADDLKYRVVDEIARDYCFQPELLAIEYYPDWQQEQEKKIQGDQVEEEDGQINATIAGPQVHDSEVEEIQRDVTCVDSSIKNFSSNPTDSCSLRESNIANTSALISIVQQCSPYIKSVPLQKKMEKVQNFSKLHSFPTSKHTGEMVAYVNDIKETQFSVSKDGYLQDQRLLRFRENSQLGYDHQTDLDQDESESENSSTRSSRKSKRVPDKRSRRRSASLENQGIMDIGCMIYYHKPPRNPSSQRTCPQYRLKHQKSFMEAFPQTCYAQKTLKHHSSSEMEKNKCSLDHPCYFCVHNNDEDCLEALPGKSDRGIGTLQIQEKPFWNEESNKGMELVSIPQRVVYNVFTYPECNQTEEQKNGKPEAYSRAVTMPPERQNNCRDEMVRTYSCPSQYPNHVHPKLPDYDDIAAKFAALKRERLENKDYSGEIKLK